MPSGLDHCAHTVEKVQHAHTLYIEIMKWSLGMQQVIVMGDLNETLTQHDRYPYDSYLPHMRSLDPYDALSRRGSLIHIVTSIQMLQHVLASPTSSTHSHAAHVVASITYG